MNATTLLPPQSSTNLKNRVNKLALPKKKPLIPLFELISNAIHAIQEKQEKIEPNLKGKVSIRIIRNGSHELLKDLTDIDKYPPVSFEVVDNGIGLDEENFVSWREFDSEKKAAIGGKGVGRLVCLKAFQKIDVTSNYYDEGQLKQRKFEYKKSKDGFEHYAEVTAPAGIKHSGTKAVLENFDEAYKKHVPYEAIEIARQIVNHFQLYFIQKKEPKISLSNQNKDTIELGELFNREFKQEVKTDEFFIGEQRFEIFISKSFKAKSHKIYYCGCERTVKDEGLSKYLVDLKNIVKEEGEEQGYYFEAFVVGKYLDENINEERTGFNFSTEEDNPDEDSEEITLSKIRRNAIIKIESILSDFFANIRKEKLETYLPIIKNDFPNYTAVFNHKKEKIEKLPAGLSKSELDLKLYEIEAEWRVEVKTSGKELLDKKKDITNLDDYKALYEKFLSNFNEIGQSDLARYVVHRRAVLDLLNKLIELNADQKFANEDIVHSLFFPIRETGESVPNEKQNLWLLDERLTYNSFLTSDKKFKKVDKASTDSTKRIDLFIKKEEVFDNATLFSEDKYPFESFSIVEFKKPERDDYVQGDIKFDPVKQVRTYVDDVIDGNHTRRGKKIEASKRTPFYCYIVADITPSLEKILKYETFVKTADGLGRFKFLETDSAIVYIEVIPFQKVIKSATERNKVLFDKLNIS